MKSHGFIAGFLAFQHVLDFAFHAVALGPALVKALEHGAPVAGFRAAGAGMDGQIGVVVVCLAVQGLVKLELIVATLKFGDLGG